MNSISSHCVMGELGVYKHFEFKHHLKGKVINNTGWQELSDIISIPTFTKPNVSKEIEDDEENYLNFIDAERNLTDQSRLRKVFP